jgi:hypothetical protein
MAGPDGKYVKPAFLGPHEGRELELMLAGKKPLSYFFIEVGVVREVFPEHEFDFHVANGFLVKDVRVEQFISPEHGEETSARDILYATASEAWRILAMRMIQDIYRSMGAGWRPDLERVIGSLLGYDRNDVELFIERLARGHGYIAGPDQGAGDHQINPQ